MEFCEITEDSYPHPGEYILYIPAQSIVICGAFMGDRIKESIMEEWWKIMSRTSKRSK